MKTFSLVELEDLKLIELGRGKVISKKDLNANPGNYPVYSSAKTGGGIFGTWGNYDFNEEMITWSVDGGGDLFHRNKHKFSITNVGGFIKVLDKNKINTKYLYYALKNLHNGINFDWVKKAHPSVLRKEYNYIPVPSLQEQKKIVEKLDKVFETIDTKINQKITLNTLYKKFINSYIEKELFQEKNPVKLKDLINVNRKNINNYSNKFVGLENIVSNTSEVVNVKSMAVKSNTYKFDKGSLLYGRLRPYLNKVTIVDFDGHCSTEIFPIDTTKELNLKYLKYFLMTQKTVNKINLQTTGARMPRASVSVLENLKIDLKSQKEQSKNVEIFDKLTILIQNIVKVNLKIIEKSKLLKKSILNKEFSYE